MNDDEKTVVAQELVALREQLQDIWREHKEREGDGALDEIRRVLAMQQAAIDNLRVRVGRLENPPPTVIMSSEGSVSVYPLPCQGSCTDAT